jgi:putative ABC transport system permease protein
MSAVLTKVLADLRRRRLQSVVLAIVILLASGTTTLGLTLLQTSHDPWERAFEAQRGAHLLVRFDSRKVSRAEAERTPALIGASAWAGSWVAGPVTYQKGDGKFRPMTAGRDSPEAPVEAIRLASGRWVQGPGEMVITRSVAELFRLHLGDRLTALASLDRPALVLVGEAIDVDSEQASPDVGTPWVWVTEAQALALLPDPEYKMVYRFAGRPSEADLRSAMAKIKAAVPPGAITDSYNYLELRSGFGITNQIALTLLLAFGVFALLACAAIIGNLVSGIVTASYSEIGIMKAIGYTPVQVVTALVGVMLLPALAGALVGIPAGVLLSLPLVEREAHSLGLATPPPFVPEVALLSLAGVLAVVVAAAALPALRAGRLRPVRAMSLGTVTAAPAHGGLGPWLRRLPLPGSLALGAGDAFARPFRGLLSTLAVLAGVVAMVFAFGLRGSMASVLAGGGALQGDVAVFRETAYPDSKVMATLESQPDTAAIIGEAGGTVLIPGVTDPVYLTAYRGDSTRLRTPMITGRWFSGPGEVVLPRATLNEAHLQVGDKFDAVVEGHPVRLRVVGEDFNFVSIGSSVEMDFSTLAQVKPDATPQRYVVFLKPGSDAAAYRRRVQATEPDFLVAFVTGAGSLAPIDLLNVVMLILAGVLSLIAIAGIFGALLLGIRERARDIAVLKAIGMRPAQVMLMVAAAAAVLGVVGSALGAPAGVAAHRVLMTTIGAYLGNDLPRGTLEVFSAADLVLLGLAGVAIALLASLLPARWASRTRVAEVLHSE